MSSVFTNEQIQDGRRTFHRFMSFNVIAFSILTGNVISVFALTLDVSNSYIGLLQSFTHLSMAFVLVGRILMQRVTAVQLFAGGWFLRYVFAALLLVIPLVVSLPNGRAVAAAILLAASGGFHIFRGIGVAGQVPIVASLASGADRGRFLSINSILANSIALAGGLTIAALLGPEAPMWRYMACFAVAIACGFASVTQVRRLPEPAVHAAARPDAFFEDVRGAVRDARLRRFLAYLAVYALTAGALIAFLVVLAKRIFQLPDNYTVLLVAIGNLGAVASGLVNRRLVDEAGAKPLLIVFQITITAVALVIAVVMRGAAPFAHLFMALAFFLALAGHSGILVSGQAYYYGLYPEEKHRNLGLLFNLVVGGMGALGSYFAGLLLDGLTVRFSADVAFRGLFIAIAAMSLVAGLLAVRLASDQRRPRRSLSRLLQTVLRSGLRRLGRLVDALRSR